MTACADGVTHKYYLSTFHRNASRNRPVRVSFDGARFYIHGAGLVGGQAAGSYRAGDTLTKLEQFWREYLTQSNASLHGFGTPELTTELR